MEGDQENGQVPSSAQADASSSPLSSEGKIDNKLVVQPKLEVSSMSDTEAFASAAHALDFKTGKPCKVPPNWSLEHGGEEANWYTTAHNRGMDLTNEKAMVWRCFRLVGCVQIAVDSKVGLESLRPRLENDKANGKKLTAAKALKRARLELVKGRKTSIWDKESGEPLLWDQGLSIGALDEKIYNREIEWHGIGCSSDKTNDELADWMFLTCGYAKPATLQWKCPGVCTKTLVSKDPDVKDRWRITIHMYFNRLMFYLIADHALLRLVKYSTPPIPIVAKVTNLEEHPPSFTRTREPLIGAKTGKDGTIQVASSSSSSSNSSSSNSSSSNSSSSSSSSSGNSNANTKHEDRAHFTVRALLRSQESTGYKQFPGQPGGIALTLRDYQLQTLQWMLDQEQLDRGLNGCMWEERAWPASTDCGSESGEQTTVKAEPGTEKTKAQKARVPLTLTEEKVQQANMRFFWSEALGELRLEAPPLVRGGLVCEEMGLGKTLEFVSLCQVSKGIPEPAHPALDDDIRSDACISDASLIVVPDVLIAQWQSEIRKSLTDPDALRVGTLLLNGNQTTFYVNNQVAESKMVVHVNRAKFLIKQIAKCDIVVCNYRAVQKCSALQYISWRRVALDEMQEVRSSTSQLAVMCKKLRARSRWMISGTPFYQGLDDLNGELAFLGVIPFSCSDQTDGFWSLCIKKPFDEKKSDALTRLKLLLDNVMIRHSKKQRYLANPRENILSLPDAEKVFVGVPMGKLERAAYAYIEAMAVRALELQRSHASFPSLNFNADAANARLGLVGLDLLRHFCVSPFLLHPLSSRDAALPPSRLRNLNNFARAVTTRHRALNNTGSQDDAMFSGVHLSEDGFPSMAMDAFRDMLLSNAGQKGPGASNSSSSSSRGVAKRAGGGFHALTKGGGAGVAASAMRENSLARLEESKRKLGAALKAVKAKKCSHDGGVLPKKVWLWAVQAITSGKYLALLRIKRNWAEVRRILKQCPLLTSRYLAVAQCARRIAIPEARADGIREMLMAKPPFELCTKLEGLDGDFDFEKDDHEEDMAGFQITNSSIKLRFGEGEEWKWWHKNPAGLRNQVIDRILRILPAYGKELKLIRHHQQKFDENLFEGRSKKLLLEPWVLRKFPAMRVEVRIDAPNLEAEAKSDGTACLRMWVPVARILRVHSETHFATVQLLDGQERVIAPNLIRVADSRVEAAAAPDSDEPLKSSCATSHLSRLSALAGESKMKSAASRFLDFESNRWAALDAGTLFTRRHDLVALFREENDGDNHGMAQRRLVRLLGVCKQLILTHLVTARINALAVSQGQDVYQTLGEILRTASSTSQSRQVGTWMAQVSHVLGFDIKEADAAKWAVMFATSSVSDLWVSNEDEDNNSVSPSRSKRQKVTLKGQGKTDATNQGDQDAVLSPKCDEWSSQEWFEGMSALIGAKGKCTSSATVRIARPSYYDYVQLRSTLTATIKGMQMRIKVESVDLQRHVACCTSLSETPKGRKEGLFVDARDIGVSSDELHVPFGALKPVAVAKQSKTKRRKKRSRQDSEAKGEEEEEGEQEEEDAGESCDEDAEDHEPKERKVNVHKSLCDRRFEIDRIRARIDKNQEIVVTLTNYNKLLSVAIDRGISNPDVVENQGFQALTHLIEGTEPRPDCSICLSEIKEPVCTTCVHLFCRDCMSQHIKAHRLMHQFSKKGNTFVCPLCRKALEKTDVYRLDDPAPPMVQDNLSGAEAGALEKVEELVGEPTRRHTLEEMRWTKHVDPEGAMKLLGKAASSLPGVWQSAVSVVGSESLSRKFAAILAFLCNNPPGLPTLAQGEPLESPSKLRKVLDDLRGFTKKDKCVVFSQLRSAISYIGFELERSGIRYQRVLKGDKQEDLQEAIRSFNDDKNVRVLILQSSSAAAGLTLTAACKVLLLEPFVKLGEEAQAINRVHRIGQKKEVEALIYYSIDTVEERMLAWRHKLERQSRGKEADTEQEGQQVLERALRGDTLDINDDDDVTGLAAEADQATSGPNNRRRDKTAAVGFGQTLEKEHVKFLLGLPEVFEVEDDDDDDVQDDGRVGAVHTQVIHDLMMTDFSSSDSDSGSSSSGGGDSSSLDGGWDR